MKFSFKTFRLATIAALSSLLLAAGASAQDTNDLYSGRSLNYQNLDADSLEDLTSPEHIIAITKSNVAPTERWRALEHAEKVECLQCIPHVSKLLYDSHDKTREIAAWWLRRRIFGVFGPGEIYEQIVGTLADTNQSEFRRVAAANAIGEFLQASGVKYVSQAIAEDPSARVREAAVKALMRLNNEGTNGELSLALSDKSKDVRLAALDASVKINVFTGVEGVVERISDSSSTVRAAAAEVLGAMRARDAVAGLIALTSPDNEPSADVRAAAVSALGRIGDADARDAVQVALDDDPDKFVRDAAKIALRLLF